MASQERFSLPGFVAPKIGRKYATVKARKTHKAVALEQHLDYKCVRPTMVKLVLDADKKLSKV
jgi:hypothetical protein